MISDIEILKEMIKPSARVNLDDHYDRKKVVLQELIPANYYITIYGMPEDDQTIIIKADAFLPPKEVFANSKSECKRADFIIVADTDKEKVIICIEMKAGSGNKEYEIIQQLKGSMCLVAYCREIGRLFWNKADFLNDYKYRFVSIKNIGISKKTQRISHLKPHDSPDRMLKINAPSHVQFKSLI